VDDIRRTCLILDPRIPPMCVSQARDSSGRVRLSGPCSRRLWGKHTRYHILPYILHTHYHISIIPHLHIYSELIERMSVHVPHELLSEAG
jgi:hypothetical protein